MKKLRTAQVMTLVAALLVAFAPTPVARADIYKWEYINPANPSLGKQQSTTLCPSGAGVNAVPGANLRSSILTKAYLIGANLTQAHFGGGGGNYDTTPAATLTDADFSHANLTNADFSGYAGFDPNDPGIYYYLGADLTGASLVQANLTGANFLAATLTNADLSHTKLNASFTSATLTGAKLTGADVRGAGFTRASVIYFPYYDQLLGGITLAQLYSTASYQAHDLTGIGLGRNELTGANLAGQKLTNASFGGARLTGADLTGADVRSANFSREYLSIGYVGGLTLTQLYSTASYLAHDLNGIGLAKNDLTGANFIGQNLTNASFARATLTNANLTGAEVRGANFSRDHNYVGSEYGSGITVAQLHSTASYQAHDLTGIGLAGNKLADVSLAGQNLTNADLSYATLTNANLSQANLTGAAVRGADFGDSITAAQLYSTTGYQTHDLIGIGLSGNNLTGANLASQDLANANFSGATLIGANLTNADFSAGYDSYYKFFVSADLTGANLSHANLTNANFSGFLYEYFDGYNYHSFDYPGANLTGANLSGADARGALGIDLPPSAITANLIQSGGHIAGLALTAGASLVVRDYDGNPAASPPTGPLPIVVDQHLAMDATGTLRLEFDADPWDSTISFAPGIPVARGGTLELAFAPGVDVAAQSGRTIDLFNWTGVTPTGAFTVSSSYSWDLTKLYTTGEITLLVPSDFNGDNQVDGADLAEWSASFGLAAGAAHSQGDADYDHDVDGADFLAWQQQFTSGPAVRPAADAVPEPSTFVLLIVAAASWRQRRRRTA